MAKSKAIEILPISLIMADENQPRKNFNPERLADLTSSIKKYGIINPLMVEKIGSKYLLVDGVRRVRAAKDMGLKSVPVLVIETASPTERLIKQFHIQEQHQGWSGIEKAYAIGKLAEELESTVSEIGEMLGIPRSTIGEYVAFYGLLEKKDFEKNEISLHYASYINRLKQFVKTKYSEIEEEFSPVMERALEKAIIHRIKTGDIIKRGDILKLHDAVKVDPQSIEKFIKNSKLSSERLFIDSKAKKAYHFRNVRNVSNVLAHHIKTGFPLGLAAMFREDEEAVAQLKKLHTTLGQLIKAI